MALNGSVILRVTPETMLNISTQFSECNASVQSLTQQMLDIANTLQSAWQSDAATQFYGALKKLEPDMTRVSNMIREHAEDLRQIAEQYQRADSDNEQIAGSLPTGGLA